MDFKKGDHGTCPVVRIKHPIVEGNDTGFTEINEDDFDSDIHELFEPEAESATTSKKKKK